VNELEETSMQTSQTTSRGMVRRNLIRVMALAPLAGSQWAAAQPQAWPGRQPIKMFVPYAAGGRTDVMARLFASKLADAIGQAVIVDNRPGSRGVLAYEALLREPEGYAFLIDNSSFTIQRLFKGLPYDPTTAIAPVAELAISSIVLLVGLGVPVKTFAEFIEYGRQNAQKVAYGSYGVGTSSHLSGELLNALTSLNMLHVAYRGSAPALADLMGGQVQAVFCDPLSAQPLVKAGRVRAIAASGFERWPAYPDVPTYREVGLEEMTSPGWFGVLTANKTPAAVVERVAVEARRIVADAAFAQKASELGSLARFLGPKDFSESIARDAARWQKVVTQRKIAID
jgi:tripartite-type tricarboxylate transporter receptor subunit TctC